MTRVVGGGGGGGEGGEGGEGGDNERAEPANEMNRLSTHMTWEHNRHHVCTYKVRSTAQCVVVFLSLGGEIAWCNLPNKE
jgi:hypothetical protein